MSADPIKNNVSFSLKGDIACSNGQLGLTTQAIDTVIGTINQVPGAQYSDYYSHYLIDISAGNSADFVLGSIGTDISIGYTMTIDCIGNGTSSDVLNVRAADLTLIGQLYTGSKLILVAVSAPNKWKTAYGVPEGTDNHLIVYTGTSPQVRTLPIQKEFYFDGSFQYGIKCIQSYDFTEPALITNLTNYNNLNRFILEGCSSINTASMASIDSAVVNSFISCSGITYTASPGLAISSAVACYGTRGLTQLKGSRGVFIAGSNAALVNNSTGPGTFDNCGIIHSNNCGIGPSNTGSMGNVSIIAANNSNINNQDTGALVTSFNTSLIGVDASSVAGVKQSSIIASSGSSLSRTSNCFISGSSSAFILDTFAATGTTNTVILGSSSCTIIRANGTSLGNLASMASSSVNITLGDVGASLFNVSVISSRSTTMVSGNEIAVISSNTSNLRANQRSGLMNCINSSIQDSIECGVISCSGGSVANSSLDSLVTSSSGSTVDASTRSFICSSTGAVISSSTNASAISSQGPTVNTSLSSNVNSSFNSSVVNSRYTNIGSSYQSAITGTTVASYINCDTCNNSITGDNVFTRGATGYDNSRAGVTVMSSYGLPVVTSLASLRYCVIGGVNAANWSIDSKTGQFYALGTFNSGAPLPGFAEMYENLVEGEIPYGRLLQLENGKVRLAKDGEPGFMISRPFESAAFVAGNPSFEWVGKYELDLYGLPVMVDYTRDEYIDAMKVIGVPVNEEDLPDVINSKKVNLSYDSKREYLPRSARRAEWTTCEKSGIVIVEYTGKVSIGDFLVSAADGIAKQSYHNTNIRVLELSSDNSGKQYAKVDIANHNVSSRIDCKPQIKSGIATGFPTNISIKGIGFADESVLVLAETQIKLSVKLLGDSQLANDLFISLVGSSNSYDLGMSFVRTKSSHVISGSFKGKIQPDNYKLAFDTSYGLPSDCEVQFKL